MKKVPTIVSLWVWVFLCLSHLGLAQMNNLSFRQIDKSQGLSSNRVNAIQQGPEGYIWFGTADGLDRFDGFNVKNYRSDLVDTSTVSPGEILSSGVSPDSVLFIGTREGVLNAYSSQKDEFVRFTIPEHESVRHGSIWGMSFDGDSLVWLALEMGLAKFDRRTSHFKLWRPSVSNRNLRPLANDVLYSIAEDPLNPDWLWLGSRGGLLHFSKKEESFDVPFEGCLASEFLAIKDISFDGDSLIWLAGNQSAVIKLKRGNWDWTAAQPQPLTSYSNFFIEKNKDGQFWVGCPIRGLGLFDKAEMRTDYFLKRKIKNQVQPSKVAFCAYFGKDGRLWVGTAEGVFTADLSQQYFKHFEREDFGVDIPTRVLTEGGAELSDGRLLVVTFYGKAIFIFDKKGESPVEVISLPPGKEHLRFTYLKKDRAGDIWLCSNAGLFQFDESQKELFQPPHFKGTILETLRAYNLLETASGYLYVAGGGASGLVQISPDRQNFKVFNYESHGQKGFPNIESLTDIDIGPDGKVWLFSESYLFRFDPETETFKSFGCHDCGQEALTGRWIVCGAVDHFGRIWVGYNSGGLDCLDSTTGQVKNYRISDGLSGEHIIEMELEKDRALWLATNNGLTRLDLTSLRFLNFTEKDGLLKLNPFHRRFSSLQFLNETEMFIGGWDYFSVLDISLGETSRKMPQLAFDDFFVFDQKKKTPLRLDHLDELQLQPDENFFTLTFSALEFEHPEQIQYRYRLEGRSFFTKNYDMGWRETREGKAVYTKVPPGDYLFQLNARIGGNDWSPEVKELSIRVEPPFYLTWWFLSAMALGVAFLLWFLYDRRIERIREKAYFEQELAETELKALRAQMNPHFLFNSLNSIKNYIVKNEPRTAARYLTKFSQLMRLILSNSKDPTVTLADELRALELYVELESLRFRQQFDYHFEVGDELNLETIEIPPLILQPFVENAIWHGLMHKKTAGKLWVRAYGKKGGLHVEVEDNGIGREKAKEIRSKTAIRQKSMGLQITSSRLSMLKNTDGEISTVTIKDLVAPDGEAAGTLVHIKIPLENENT